MYGVKNWQNPVADEAGRPGTEPGPDAHGMYTPTSEK